MLLYELYLSKKEMVSSLNPEVTDRTTSKRTLSQQRFQRRGNGTAARRHVCDVASSLDIEKIIAETQVEFS